MVTSTLFFHSLLDQCTLAGRDLAITVRIPQKNVFIKLPPLFDVQYLMSAPLFSRRSFEKIAFKGGAHLGIA